MFSRFTTRGGKTLIIRSVDLRVLRDEDDGCMLSYELAGEIYHERVQGTAQENLDRLGREELEAIDRVQRVQQRGQQGMPPIPIQRGRQRV